MLTNLVSDMQKLDTTDELRQMLLDYCATASVSAKAGRRSFRVHIGEETYRRAQNAGLIAVARAHFPELAIVAVGTPGD